MSDADTRTNWTDRELLVYILTAMEHSGVKLDYINAPIPVGRNASGFAQRVTRLKKALKSDMDALRNGMPVSDTKVRCSNEGKGQSKRKAGGGEEEKKSRKRGRARKVGRPEMEGKQEATPETEGLGGEDGAEEEI